jgi:hypothetical protein
VIISHFSSCLKIIAKIVDFFPLKITQAKLTYRCFDSLILENIFSIKMMETILDQLESCRYDVCVKTIIKIGMIKGVSFFTLSGH